MKQKPYWYKLIFHWVKNEKRDGLTIPFILGAKKEINSTEKVSVEDFDELFKEIINYTDDENIVTFFYCDTIGENVLGLIGRAQETYYNGKPFANSETGETTLLIGNGLQLGKNLEEIISSLKSKHKIAIEKEFFSLNHFDWGLFTEKDKQMIMEALYI